MRPRGKDEVLSIGPIAVSLFSPFPLPRLLSSLLFTLYQTPKTYRRTTLSFFLLSLCPRMAMVNASASLPISLPLPPSLPTCSKIHTDMLAVARTRRRTLAISQFRAMKCETVEGVDIADEEEGKEEEEEMEDPSETLLFSFTPLLFAADVPAGNS